MTALDRDTTLADLVTARPGVAPLLDRLGLDYCCGGQRRLVDAVDAAGLDLDEVVASLTAVDVAPASEDWSSMDAAALVDHLEATHHAYLRDALPRLDALVDKVTTVHGSRHAELGEVQTLFRALRADLEPHLLKEEQVLFPMIRELASASTAPTFHCGSLGNPIRVMLLEHDAVGDLLVELRAATDGYAVPDDGCASYRALYAGLADLEADTHVHVHKENNLLFPAVLAAEAALAGGRQ
jgi:regulator of cell morphogenesis and NO signaling